MFVRTLQRPLVTCFGDVDLVHAAHPVTGLIELADAGEIDLRFRFQDRRIAGRGVWTLWLHIEAAGASYPVAIDLHDGADYVSEASLRNCYRYYKVNLSERTFSVAAGEFHDRLRPYGPYFPCRPRRDRALFRRWLANLAVKVQHRLLYAVKEMSWDAKRRELASETRRHRRYLSRKVWNEYEAPPLNVAAAVSPHIVYNPTCWDEAESDEVRRLNDFRAELIVALRREFGEQFVGGFRNVGPSVGRYPTAIESQTISHEQYVQLLQSSSIVIYSNGKFGCFSWRLGEAFAASKCIVSERMPNDAGTALDERVGCIQVADIAEMIGTLRRLIGDRDLVAEYSRRANAYYLERVQPQMRMRLLIDEVLNRQTTAAMTATS